MNDETLVMAKLSGVLVLSDIRDLYSMSPALLRAGLITLEDNSIFGYKFKTCIEIVLDPEQCIGLEPGCTFNVDRTDLIADIEHVIKALSLCP